MLIVYVGVGGMATLEDSKYDREIDRRRVEKMLRDIVYSDEEMEPEK